MIQQLLVFLQVIMTEMTEVKYTVANNSIHVTESIKSTAYSTGYHLFAAEGKTLLPHQVTPVKIELQTEIPNGYFGKIHPRSSLLKSYFISCDASVIDSDFRGLILVLMTNNSSHPLITKAGQKIVQIVFHKNEEVVFK